MVFGAYVCFGSSAVTTAVRTVLVRITRVRGPVRVVAVLPRVLSALGLSFVSVSPPAYTAFLSTRPADNVRCAEASATVCALQWPICFRSAGNLPPDHPAAAIDLAISGLNCSQSLEPRPSTEARIFFSGL